MEELKQVILAVSSSFPMLILSVNDVAMCVKCFELRSNTLYKFKDHYVHNHSSKQGQIPYLHDILNKSQGKHSLKPNYYHLFFFKKKNRKKYKPPLLPKLFLNMLLQANHSFAI